MSSARFLLFAPGARFPDAVAEALVAEYRERLPDLTRLNLVLASPALAAPLRAALARAAGGAVMSPRISSLARDALDALPADSPAPLSALACRLQLTEWLGRLRSVFPGEDPGRVADALFDLFEDLALNAVTLPADEAAFAEQLRAAYGAPLSPEALSREARIVHTLWRFYVEEIGDRAPAIARLRGLRAALAAAKDTLLIGFDALSRAEAALIAPALAEGRAALWTRGAADGRAAVALQALAQRLRQTPVVVPSTTTPRAGLLSAWLADGEETLLARAAALKAAGASGPTGLRMVAASSAEHEARIVDLAVREAVLAGQRRIAVVSSDRRLARRLRALLERAGLGLEDRVGWALSTSRAAAALSSWLECLETGFHFRPLLDLLKSGFFTGEPVQRPEPVLAARLERVLMFPRRDAPPAPVAGLAALAGCVDHSFPALFERLRLAAIELPVNGPAQLAADWARGLLASLSAVGIVAGLADDDAGSQVVAALRQIETAVQGIPLRLRWSEFRAVLDRHLEEATFRPAPAGIGAPRVALYTLEQTQGLQADLVILASATPAQLPGHATGELFFNQSVRHELGLEGWAERQALALARLRNLLEAAPQIIISYAADQDGERAQPAPWLEALSALAEAAGHAPLHDEALAERAASAESQIAALHPQAIAAARMPAPSARAALLPRALSASGHQMLIDCPYRWHVRYALGLDAGSAPDDPVTRADFGERVHLILRSFHEHHDPAMPPPYAGPLDAADPAPVVACLRTLADAAFARDLAARPLARIWRREFEALTPWLADTLIERSRDVQVQVEWEQPRSVAGWTLKGTIDRLESDAGGQRIVDYKTGSRVPKLDEIKAGEAVQLPHYGLEAGRAASLEYWKLAADKEKDRLQAVPDAELTPLLAGVEARLAQLRRDIDAGHALPAHGDEAVCTHCDYRGVCRLGARVPA